MRSPILENVSLDLLSILPLVLRSTHKKLIKSSHPDLDVNITPLHFEVIRLLEEDGSLRVAEIGEKLQIAKAQMTQLINKLVDLDLVERHTDSVDRRATNVSLTDYGKTILMEFKNAVMTSVQDSLASLSEGELAELSDFAKKVTVNTN